MNFKDHYLDPLVEDGPVKAFYLRKDESRMFSVLLLFSPEGISIVGDSAPGENYSVHTFPPYSLKWFIGKFDKEYLAEKFLRKTWNEDDVEEWFKYELEETKKHVEEGEEGLGDRLEAIEDILSRGAFAIHEVYEAWKDAASDSEDFPGNTYNRHDVEQLSSIQRRFAELYHEKYLKEEEDDMPGMSRGDRSGPDLPMVQGRDRSVQEKSEDAGDHKLEG